MKKFLTLMAVVCVSANAMSQSDSTITSAKQGDTLRIGNMIIIRNGDKTNTDNYKVYEKKAERNRDKKLSNVSTNWAIFDIGFTNYSDKTNYGNTGTYLYNRPGTAPLGASDFNLNAGKSVNVNFWLFMQRLNLVKHHLNLKYGLGVELNNYRYSSNISYQKQNPYIVNQAPAPVVIRDSVSFSKNKLAADYVTVPFMINYTTHPGNQNKGFSISLGVSAGYLYSQRNKQVGDSRGKQVNRGGYDLEQFKISYIGEIGIGPIRLYGSYVPNTIYKTGLDMRPYTLGVRFSNW